MADALLTFTTLVLQSAFQADNEDITVAIHVPTRLKNDIVREAARYGGVVQVQEEVENQGEPETSHAMRHRLRNS